MRVSFQIQFFLFQVKILKLQRLHGAGFSGPSDTDTYPGFDPQWSQWKLCSIVQQNYMVI